MTSNIEHYLSARHSSVIDPTLTVQDENNNTPQLTNTRLGPSLHHGPTVAIVHQILERLPLSAMITMKAEKVLTIIVENINDNSQC